jgi:hypothetical protein
MTRIAEGHFRHVLWPRGDGTGCFKAREYPRICWLGPDPTIASPDGLYWHHTSQEQTLSERMGLQNDQVCLDQVAFGPSIKLEQKENMLVGGGF